MARSRLSKSLSKIASWFRDVKDQQVQHRERQKERHHADKKVTARATGRAVLAARERDGHLTTHGRRALGRDQFALPPGPEEKRRGIKGRLPIDELDRARSALARASMLHNRGDLTKSQLTAAQRKINRAWPQIHVTAIEGPRARAHATMRRGGMTKADVVREFNELYPPETFRGYSGRIDRPMRAEAWNNYTDSLQRDGRITMKQYESWTHPWKD